MPISTRTSRKRSREADVSDQENQDPNFTDGPRSKVARLPDNTGDIRRFLTEVVTPEPQEPAKTKAKPGPVAQKASPRECEKTYKQALKDVAKKVRAMDAVVRKQKQSIFMVNTDTYAEVMAHYLPRVAELAAARSAHGLKLAFNLTLYLGEHAYSGGIDYDFKQGSYGDTDVPYAQLDAALLRLMDARQAADPSVASAATELPAIPKRWSMEQSGVLDEAQKAGKRRWNKQQWNWMQAEKKEVNQARSDVLMERREKAQDWVGSALLELADQREFLDHFGLGLYMEKSIARLQELKGSTP